MKKTKQQTKASPLKLHFYKYGNKFYIFFVIYNNGNNYFNFDYNISFYLFFSTFFAVLLLF